MMEELKKELNELEINAINEVSIASAIFTTFAFGVVGYLLDTFIVNEKFDFKGCKGVFFWNLIFFGVSGGLGFIIVLIKLFNTTWRYSHLKNKIEEKNPKLKGLKKRIASLYTVILVLFSCELVSFIAGLMTLASFYLSRY